MSEAMKFTVYARPEPQGSMKGFVRGGRVILTSANAKMKPYRQELTLAALKAAEGMQLPIAGKHVPVALTIDFYLARPVSIPKKRSHCVVKPDADKLIRATADALTGVLYQDDAQIISLVARKHYGVPERAEIQMEVV